MPNKTQHWKRIKISNKKHKFDKDDCFVLTIPELDIIGYRNEKTINNKTLSKIKIFITINMEYIDMFYNYELSDDEFKAILKPYYEKTI